MGSAREAGEVQPLKEWRLRRHWGYRELARRAEVSVDTVQRAERGSKLHEVTQRKLADALGVTVSQIAEFASKTATEEAM